MKKNRFSKIVSGLLALVLCAAFLAGCAVKDPGQGNATNEPTDAPDASAEPTAEPTEEPKEALDLSKYPFYVDPAEATYDFGEKGKSTKPWNNAPVYRPYWLGNVIYQETVLCIDDGSEISGKLQYTPVKILSVRDNTYKKEYKEGEDYTVSGSKIVLTANTACPYLTKENLKGKNLPSQYRAVSDLGKVTNVETDYFMWTEDIFFTEGSLIYGHQICVSYVYDVNELDRTQFAEFGTVCPKFLEKLRNGEKVVIGITGDSVSYGCSASSLASREPYMPQFPALLSYAINEEYGVKPSIKNYSVGGTTSNEAVSTKVAEKLVKSKSDLVLIHFGINDSGGVTAAKLKSNVKKVIDDTLAELPDCEFLYIKCFAPNPVLYPEAKFRDYWKAIDELAAEYDCFYAVDLYSPSMKMIEAKKYLDVTGNGINHPNDFVVRFYAMNLVNLFVDYCKPE